MKPEEAHTWRTRYDQNHHPSITHDHARFAMVTSGAGGGAGRLGSDALPSLVNSLHKQLLTSGASASLTLKGYPLPDRQVATVRLQKFSLWAPDALITVFDGKTLLGEGQPRGLLQMDQRAHAPTGPIWP